MISTSDQLAEFCQKLAQSGFVTADTEFMRQSTYWPQLCLIQLAAPDIEAVIDPLAPELDLGPFFELMADPRVVKVFHAARQDVEIIHHMAGIIPMPIFDTQIAAMVCGFGESASYSALVKGLLRKTLDKSSRFTDWARRPLSEKQLRYALGDVTHLRGVYQKLKTRLEATERTCWLDEELAELIKPENYMTEPEHAWLRLKNRARNPGELAVMIEVAAWREREAQTLNVPRGRIVKDDTIYDVMTQAPKSLDELSRLRTIHDGFIRSARARELVEAVKRGLARPAGELPDLRISQPLPSSATAVADLLRVLLKAVAAEHDVAAKLIATTEDLDKIALSDDADVPALHGWRRELFGEAALAVKAGHLGLSVENGRIVTLPLHPSAAEKEPGSDPVS